MSLCRRGHKRPEGKGEQCPICLSINRQNKDDTTRMNFNFGVMEYDQNMGVLVASEFLNACMFDWGKQ